MGVCQSLCGHGAVQMHKASPRPIFRTRPFGVRSTFDHASSLSDQGPCLVASPGSCTSPTRASQHAAHKDHRCNAGGG